MTVIVRVVVEVSEDYNDLVRVEHAETVLPVRPIVTDEEIDYQARADLLDLSRAAIATHAAAVAQRAEDQVAALRDVIGRPA